MAAEKPLDHIAYRLLLRAHPPEIASSIFNEKLLHKPLVLRPTSPDPNSQDARALRRRQRLRKKEHIRRRQKPKPLSAKEKRMLGVYDIPKEAQKYDLYLPLHRLWLEYMQEILGLREGEQGYVTAQSAGSKLASADYHGALLEVVRSKCVERVGCQGIVLKDTKFTFEVITVKNVLRTIPKGNTLFRFEIPLSKSIQADNHTTAQTDVAKPALQPLVFELNGSQFEIRATDRATKKFKQKRLDNL